MKTTFSRTFSTTVIILLLSLILVGTSFQVLVEDFLAESAIAELQRNSTAVANLASAYSSEGGMLNRDFMVNLDIVSGVSDSDILICDAGGRVILCSDSITGCDHQRLRVDKAYLDKVIANGGDTATGKIPDLYEETRYVVATPITDFISGHNLGIVIASTPTRSTAAIMTRISNIFMVVSLLVVLISVIAMIILVRRQSDPLRQMAQVARSFGHGDLDARVRLADDYPEEVEELALAFNNMAQELQKSEYQRKEFVANVSHELKTPMTTISGYVDGILDGTIPPEKGRQYLELVSQETKRLNRLVRSMLDISRLQEQGGMPEEQKSRFDLSELAGQVLITFEQKIIEKDISVEVEMPEHPVFTRANQDAINQVIYNLVDNAVKFCPRGGNLKVTVREGGNKAYLSVANDGEGIPAQELPLVFERFHKLDKSRSRNRDSWGLGLYIVKTIVDSHGENISVTSSEHNTEFTFTLPLVR